MQTFSHDGHRALSSIIGWQAGRQFDTFLHLHAYIRLNHFPVTVSKHNYCRFRHPVRKKLADNLYAPDHQTHTTSQAMSGKKPIPVRDEDVGVSIMIPESIREILDNRRKEKKSEQIEQTDLDERMKRIRERIQQIKRS